MKKCKLLILLLLLLMGSASVRAVTLSVVDEVPVINFVVWTNSGETVAYCLAEHPVVTVSGDRLILATRESIVEYSVGDVKKFTFEPLYYFVAWLNDGSRYAYALDEHPVVTYSNGELLLTTSSRQVVYQASNVHKFTFSASDITSDEPLPPTTGVSLPEQPQHFIQQGDVAFTGCRAGSTICIYTLDGKLLQTMTVDETSKGIIDTASYPAGIYIIKTETTTHKIIKR